MKPSRHVAREIPVFAVVPPNVLLLDVAGPMEVLRKANLEQQAVRFVTTYVGPASVVGSSIGLSVAGIAPLPERLPDGAFVLLSGNVSVPMAATTAAAGDVAGLEQEIVAWLKRVVRPSIAVASICSGALLAARAGLLDGKACTTHHASIAELRKLAPLACVEENRLFVIDGERLTSAGVTSGVDLMLHVVAAMTSPAVAVAVARYLVVYLRRSAADPQLSPWLEGRNHIHPAIHRAQDAIAAEPARAWSLSGAARVAGTSPRNLSRLFNQHAGMSVTTYVNRMRVALARQLVLGSHLDIETVAERSGFQSARQLRRAWGRLHDMPPSRARAEGGVDEQDAAATLAPLPQSVTV
ncbi:MAG: helix-turn-helix domain-containing protein [Roseiarcus sp.]|jgi:transcriptional regulator GlxA family with amidase domain